ncbi:MAG TPA: hypothetical protein DF613_04065, partial [Lachnospiraceae bacterium]|nr:hypothetical protein [Lachnospiraceae bacterium]
NNRSGYSDCYYNYKYRVWKNMNDKILIADDDVRINELLCEDFSQEGYEVISVYDGGMLIEMMEKVNDISLIILDVMM